MPKGKRKKSKSSPTVDSQNLKKSKTRITSSDTEDLFHPVMAEKMVESVAGCSSEPTPSVVMYSISEEDVLRIATKVKEIMFVDVQNMIEAKIHEAVSLNQNELEGIKNENKRLETELSILRETVDTFRLSLDDLEQYSRRSCLRISGIRESLNEDTDKIVLDVAKDIGASISPSDIDRSHRVGKPRDGKPREIIVKMSTYKARQTLISNRKKLKDTRRNVYINEDLTKARKNIAFECRKLLKDQRINQTWTYDGRIFLRDKSDIKLCISSTKDLDKFRV